MATSQASDGRASSDGRTGSRPGSKAAPTPSFGTMFRRGLLRRCANCGDRHAFFRMWLLKKERCDRCGIRWDRGTDGQELGAVVINLILTVAVVLVGMGLALWSTYPDVLPLPMAIGGIVGSAVAYTLVYPIGYTVYHAIDLAIRRPDAEELAEAAAAVGAGPAVATTTSDAT